MQKIYTCLEGIFFTLSWALFAQTSGISLICWTFCFVSVLQPTHQHLTFPIKLCNEFIVTIGNKIKLPVMKSSWWVWYQTISCLGFFISMGFLVSAHIFLPLHSSVGWVLPPPLVPILTTFLFTFLEKVEMKEAIALNSFKTTPFLLPIW